MHHEVDFHLHRLCEPNTSDKQLSFLVFVYGFKELSLRIVSLGIVCMGTFIRNTSLASLRVGSFAWELSFGILRFETSVWKLSIDNLRLGPFIYYINHISYGIIMAYLWSSLVWIIWHIIYCIVMHALVLTSVCIILHPILDYVA